VPSPAGAVLGGTGHEAKILLPGPGAHHIQKSLTSINLELRNCRVKKKYEGAVYPTSMHDNFKMLI